MIDPIKHSVKSTSKPSAPLFDIRIVLNGTQPPIWRLLRVPGHSNLGWLHAVIQVAMGWTNSHLHQFHVGNQIYSDPGFELDGFGGGPAVMDEHRSILMNIAPKAADMLGYEYDFGDSWEHQITVEKIAPPDTIATQTAHCLQGARACPPEDCGGVWGYAELLKTVKNRKHKEYKSMMEWLGGKFDPEAFEIEKVNMCLRKLKWPRVTESQLRKVLMARDNYQE